MKTVFEELKSKTEKHVKNFISDFEIDKKIIEKNKGVKFIHIAREHGTALTLLHTKKDYPEQGEKVKYLFGKANRKEILKGQLIAFNHYLSNSPKAIYFFNGKALKQCTNKAAEQIFKDYYNNMINLFEHENTQIETT